MIPETVDILHARLRLQLKVMNTVSEGRHGVLSVCPARAK